jgi:hypothetical protein
MTKHSGSVKDESSSVHDYSDDDEGDDDDEEDTKGESVNTPSSRGQKRSLAGSGSGSGNGSNGEPDDDKKAERRKANRRSAFQSRQRRKILIEDLQRTVAALSKDNTDLRKSNDDLRVQLEATLVENHQFRMQQALSGVSAGGGGTGAGAVNGLFQGGSTSSALQQLQSAQFSALLQGAAASGGQSTSQLLGMSSSGAGNAEHDSLLNARLALLAAQAQSRAPDHHQSQAATLSQQGGLQGVTAATLQSLLDSASRAGGAAATAAPASAASGLQPLLDSSARAGGAGVATGAQLAGLQHLLDSAVRAGLGGSHASINNGGLSDVQRAIFEASGLGGPSVGRMGGYRGGPSLDNMGSTSVSNGMSEALRNYLQKNQHS